MIRVYDESGNVIETHEHAGDFQRVLAAIKWERGNLGRPMPVPHNIT